jgi:tRNA-specific 2-thiouridylase
VRCNSEVKWEEFLRKAQEVGCDYIATGHYSLVERGDNGRWYIRRGVDTTRDQSYVLWGLKQEALARTLMPLGGLRKTEVRDIARKYELRTAEKAESREICFVADNDYRRFLREHEQKQGRTFEPGEVVHTDGTVLGRHEGTAFFTIGQRKKLGVSYPTPLYVRSIDTESHRVIVGDDSELYEPDLAAEKINWVGIDLSASDSSARSFEADVKIRYLHPPARATVEPLTGDRARVRFVEKQRAITPGQSVVFYDGDILLGGGLIA